MSNGHKETVLKKYKRKPSGTANMQPGSRNINTPDNFREDSAPKKFSAADAIAARKARLTPTTTTSTPVVARTGKPKKKSPMSKAITGRAEGYRTYNIKGVPTVLSSSDQRLGGYSSTMGRPVSEADYTPRHQGGNLNIGYRKGGEYTVKGGWKPKKKNR